MTDQIRIEIPPGGEHDFVGKVMLYFSLQPYEKIIMSTHGYPFLDYPGVSSYVFRREGKGQVHIGAAKEIG